MFPSCFNTWPDENSVTHVNCIMCGATVINNTNWRGLHQKFHEDLESSMAVIKASVKETRAMVEPADGSYPPRIDRG